MAAHGGRRPHHGLPLRLLLATVTHANRSLFPAVPAPDGPTPTSRVAPTDLPGVSPFSRRNAGFSFAGREGI